MVEADQCLQLLWISNRIIIPLGESARSAIFIQERDVADYNYDFPDKSLVGLTGFFEHNPTGQQFTNFLAESFSSAHELLKHTRPVDGSSVIHLLTGDTATIQDVSKREWRSVVHAVTRYFGFQP